VEVMPPIRLQALGEGHAYSRALRQR
jgi:hypothetical protein